MGDTFEVNADNLLKRLQEEPKYIEELNALMVEDILTRPIRDLVAPAWIASSIAADIKATVALPDFQSWLESRFRMAMDRIPDERAPLRGSLPPDLIEVGKTVLGRPSTPGRELVRTLVDQPGVRNLLQTILKRTLTDFGSKLGSTMPNTSKIPGSRFRSKLMGVAKTVASSVSSEIERQMEDRINGFLRGAMGKVIDSIVDRICDPSKAQEAATFRINLVDALLDLPRHHFRGEVRKIDPKQSAGDVHAALTALANWDKLESEIQTAIEEYASQEMDRTIRDYLEGSGLEDVFKPRLMELMGRYSGFLVENPAFSQWIAKLCE